MAPFRGAARRILGEKAGSYRTVRREVWEFVSGIARIESPDGLTPPARRGRPRSPGICCGRDVQRLRPLGRRTRGRRARRVAHPGFLLYPFLLPGVGFLLFLSVLPVSVVETLNEAFVDTFVPDGGPAAGRVVIVLGSLLFWGALVSVWLWLRRRGARR